jgi:hypothetical protein
MVSLRSGVVFFNYCKQRCQKKDRTLSGEICNSLINFFGGNGGVISHSAGLSGEESYLKH